jgi:3-methyladenine DNA glycosylase Tag
VPADLTPTTIRTIDEYLEVIARAIFSVGLSWSAVETTWPATRAAFDRFAATRVAAYDDRRLSEIVETPGVIGNPRKAAAVVEAARRLLELREEHGSVRRWLVGLGTFEEQARALRSLPFIGPFGAYYVLSVSGYEVPTTWNGEGA